AGSGGVYLEDGYSHFALNHSEPSSQEFTLVHELTHVCLAGCPLPLWLEEGITQLTEEAILGYSGFTMNREELVRHQEYWRENGLRSFWMGLSFHNPDDGGELSYALAQVLTRNLLSRGRGDFLCLLKDAHPLDCGDRAMRTIYGFGLGDVAAHFLGEGEWDWTPVEPTDFYYRALLHQEHREYREAIRDFEAAIADSDDAVHLNALAWLLCTCPEDSIRNGERAVELATRACELSEWKLDAILDTLGAAYAEAGDFDNAVKWARAAIDLAEMPDPGDEVRLRLFEEGQPYREDPGQPGHSCASARYDPM
ncbi:MAG: hypothetical protein AAF517_18645, partial [Planctomycetota bacterium]